MTDPVAEAAAALAKQQAEPSLLEKAMDTIHDLEAKVEHLIHPEAAETVPNVTPGSPAIDASATLSDVSGKSSETASSATQSEPSSTETPAPASAIGSSEPSTSTQTLSVGSESPNVLGTEPSTSTGSSASADLPNVLPASTSGIAGVLTPSAGSGLKAVSETAASDIRSSVNAIKAHLHMFGFEASAVEKIHTELATIEKWL